MNHKDAKIEAGLLLETEEEPVPEKNGFHACVSPISALRWFAVRPTPNLMISRVQLSGEIIEDNKPFHRPEGDTASC